MQFGTVCGRGTTRSTNTNFKLDFFPLLRFTFFPTDGISAVAVRLNVRPTAFSLASAVDSRSPCTAHLISWSRVSVDPLANGPRVRCDHSHRKRWPTQWASTRRMGSSEFGRSIGAMATLVVPKSKHIRSTRLGLRIEVIAPRLRDASEWIPRTRERDLSAVGQFGLGSSENTRSAVVCACVRLNRLGMSAPSRRTCSFVFSIEVHDEKAFLVWPRSMCACALVEPVLVVCVFNVTENFCILNILPHSEPRETLTKKRQTESERHDSTHATSMNSLTWLNDAAIVCVLCACVWLFCLFRARASHFRRILWLHEKTTNF